MLCKIARLTSWQDWSKRRKINKATSDLANIGHYVLARGIFEIEKKWRSGRAWETQLVDFIKTQASNNAVDAINLNGRYFVPSSTEGDLGAIGQVVQKQKYWGSFKTTFSSEKIFSHLRILGWENCKYLETVLSATDPLIDIVTRPINAIERTPKAQKFSLAASNNMNRSNGRSESGRRKLCYLSQIF